MGCNPTKAQQRVIGAYFDGYKLTKVTFGGKTEYWMEKPGEYKKPVRRDVAERCLAYKFVPLNRFANNNGA